MSKVYDNLRKPQSDTTGLRRSRDQIDGDLDLFTFAEARRAREKQKTEEAAPPAFELEINPAPTTASVDDAPEVREFVREEIKPPEPLLRRPAVQPLRKPSLNIFSDEAASAGYEQEAHHPLLVSRWIGGGVAVILILMLPFLIFKKRDTSTSESAPLAQRSEEPSVVDDESMLNDVETVVVRESRPESETTPDPLAAAPSAPPAPVSKPAPPASEIPGALVRASGHELTVVYRDGLFSKGWTLAPASLGTLEKTAGWLASKAGRYEIQVVGCTDDESVRPNSEYKSNRELGLLRARAVVQFLETRPELKSARITASSRGDKDAPYPNDTKQNRRKNRTVIIRLSPK